jgi:vacuolar-type H+-ATPase subunit E/Vma4
MITKRIINKYRKMVLEKLGEILSKNKFKLNFKPLESNINENFDKLIDDGLKFNINKSIIKKFL